RDADAIADGHDTGHLLTADRRLRTAGRRVLTADGRLAVEGPLHDRIDRGARVAAHRAGIAGRHETRCRRDRRGPRLQLRDDVVDLAARLAHLRVEFVGQPLAVGLLALAQRVFTLTDAPFGFAQRLAFLRRQALLVLERAHVAVDLGQM